MGKDLIRIAELSTQEMTKLLHEATRLKEEWLTGGNQPLLAGLTLGLLFQKASLRTRVSFAVGMQHLGGTAVYLSPDEVQLGARESVPDVARVLSRYVDGIAARVFSHEHILQLAEYSRVPVINALSDFSHPCQALADLLTISERRGNLAGLKLAWVGDGNNMLHSLLYAASKAGIHIVAATPAGYEPEPSVVAEARVFAAENQSIVELTGDPAAAVDGADIIYADTWVSMGQESERELRLRVFPPYQVNAELLTHAKPDVMVMHCMPAHRGDEITDEVMDGPHSVVFDQAENRLHAQKAILASFMA